MVCEYAWKQSSEQVGLLHDADELLLRNLTVAVAVCFVDHFLELVVRHGLSQLPGDALQIAQRDLAGVIVVEQPEGLQDFLARITLSLP